MVKTDGGSNMTANTFELTLPGWQEDDEDQSMVIPTVSTPPTITADDSEGVEEIEIEFSLPDCDPVWEILRTHGVSLSTEDAEEIIELEYGLDETMPSSNSITLPTAEKPGYKLEFKLRSDCAAHKLQLVIKDGFKKLLVIILETSV